MPQKYSIQLVYDAPNWKRLRKLPKALDAVIATGLAIIPADLRKIAKKSIFTVLLSDDKAVKKLNHDWRGKNKPTNVLSFPQFSARDVKKQKGDIFLGDIALAYTFVKKEAEKEDKKLIDHATHLVLHGFFHLLGYDHLRLKDAAHMEELERKTLKKLGLDDPYALPDSPAIKKRKKPSKKAR